WRLLETDEFETPFHIYRQYDGESKIRLTEQPLVKATCFQDTTLQFGKNVTYSLCRVSNVGETLESVLSIDSHAPIQNYLEIPMKIPAGYSPADMSVGDLDGDGKYELIVHQTGKAHDNSHTGITDRPIFQAYQLDGTLLWEIDLGINIREGAHY